LLPLSTVKQQGTGTLVTKFDQFGYNLYGLTEEEIGIVEIRKIRFLI